MSSADNLKSPSIAESGHRRDSAGRVARVVKKKGELLTDNEKKANHIVSEQKRRHNIRTGYDQLIQIVPTLTPSQQGCGVNVDAEIACKDTNVLRGDKEIESQDPQHSTLHRQNLTVSKQSTRSSDKCSNFHRLVRPILIGKKQSP
ncbi:hypothetical protein H4R24_002566 [Coemansia sp. RSA 988]|nr:hypothetical protein H4R24_002566 [Coemansia sp. RSA 988]